MGIIEEIIQNAPEEPIETTKDDNPKKAETRKDNDLKKSETSKDEDNSKGKTKEKTKITFEDIRYQLVSKEKFLKMRGFYISWNFPNLIRICEDRAGQKVAEFRPKNVQYFNAKIKDEIKYHFKHTKFKSYFDNKMKLKEIK